MKPLTARQRRRIARILRELRTKQAMYGGLVYLYGHCAHRDARRIGEMGLACPVISKTSFWNRTGIKEVTLFPTREDAAKRYPSWTMLPRSRRGC